MSVVHLTTNFTQITALGSQYLDTIHLAFNSTPLTFKNVSRTDNKINFTVFNELFVIKLVANYADGFTYSNICVNHIDIENKEHNLFSIDYDKIGNIFKKYTNNDFAPDFIQTINLSIHKYFTDNSYQITL